MLQCFFHVLDTKWYMIRDCPADSRGSGRNMSGGELVEDVMVGCVESDERCEEEAVRGR